MPSSQPPYEVKIERCRWAAGRYQWKILLDGKPIESSRELFTTENQARRDALTKLQKLSRKSSRSGTQSGIRKASGDAT
jgi:hypothetical protein